jgi:hypothetical protein
MLGIIVQLVLSWLILGIDARRAQDLAFPQAYTRQPLKKTGSFTKLKANPKDE